MEDRRNTLGDLMAGESPAKRFEQTAQATLSLHLSGRWKIDVPVKSCAFWLVSSGHYSS